MRYTQAFRDPALGRGLVQAINETAAAVPGTDPLPMMEFCGGHTHAIARHGLEDLLPPRVRLIHGPGCPVCVLPVGRLDMALDLVRRHRVTLCTYGDMMRVPASGGDTLFAARAEGGDVRMVYSSLDAVAIAAREPDRPVVFFAIGFETTTPPTAVALVEARRRGIANFSVFCNHVLTPAALGAILGDPAASAEDSAGAPVSRPRGAALRGIIGPAHVSTVIGARAYAPVVEAQGIPVAIAGFEPLDVLQAVLMLLRQIADGRAEVENQYRRAVTWEGNARAQALVADLFETRTSFAWRGLGAVPRSALRLRDDWVDLDAEQRFALVDRVGQEPPGCACGAVLRGLMGPADCPLFGRRCTPETPVGACMVSQEGACAALWSYGRVRLGASSRPPAADLGDPGDSGDSGPMAP